MNAWLWHVINGAGWWWWGPCIVLAARNLYLLTTLSAPTTTIGRAARTFAWLAHLPMLFVPWFNALGCVSLPLLLAASNLLYEQLRAACLSQPPSPNRGHRSRRILDSLFARIE